MSITAWCSFSKPFCSWAYMILVITSSPKSTCGLWLAFAAKTFCDFKSTKYATIVVVPISSAMPKFLVDVLPGSIKTTSVVRFLLPRVTVTCQSLSLKSLGNFFMLARPICIIWISPPFLISLNNLSVSAQLSSIVGAGSFKNNFVESGPCLNRSLSFL